MKRSCALWLVLIPALVILITGCASQTKKAEATPHSPEPSQPAGADAVDQETASPLTPEEEALLENDFDELESDDSLEAALVPDPIEPFNRVMFKFNEKLYDWVLRPVALGYRKVTPQKVRVGISNFFNNLTTPVRFTNCILQGKGQAASAEVSKFIFNSTFGVLGFGDLFKDYPEMYPDTEDLGQTLGSYGIGDGFYIVWPILGSYTLRDTVGLVGDSFLSPLNYVDSTEARLAGYSVDRVNTVSFRIEDIDAARKAAFDPYIALRNFTIQSRRSKIKK